MLTETDAPVLRRQASGALQIEACHKNHYEEFGYCVVPNLFSEPELDAIDDFFQEYRRCGAFPEDAPEAGSTERAARVMVPHRFNGKTLEILRIQAWTLLGASSWQRKVTSWLLHAKVAAALEVLLGRPAFGAHAMFYYKPPGAQGLGMHQDNYYVLAKPGTSIAAWTPIDSADVDNGCMWVIPGSQRGPIVCPGREGKKWMDYDDSHITNMECFDEPVPVPVKRGETMFFSGNIIHGSGPNLTEDRARRTFVCHYIDGASEQVGDYYHPVLTMDGQAATQVAVFPGAQPCGGDT